MDKLWELWLRYWPDLVIAVVLAFVFAVVVDLLRISSGIRASVRWLKDKAAESSVREINQRIAQQEKYRNQLQSYLDSDKAFYLAMLRNIVGLLLFMCIAGVVVILSKIKYVGFPPAPAGELIALAALGIAITSGAYTMQLGSYDNSKFTELIKKLDVEIAKLKEARDKLRKGD